MDLTQQDTPLTALLADEGLKPEVSKTLTGRLKRLAIVGPSAFAIARLRGNLIKAAIAQGCTVLTLSPGATETEDLQSLSGMGASVNSFELRPTSFSLFPARRTTENLAAKLRDWHPHTLLAYGAEVVPTAVAAGRLAKIEHIAVLVNEIPPAGLSKRMLLALRQTNTVIAHNTSDEKHLRALLAGAPASLLRVPGTGADLSIEPGVPMPKNDERLIFLAAMRLDRIKGVHDYLEAARLARDMGINAEFRLAGHEATGAGAVREDTLKKYADCVTFMGNLQDTTLAIRQSHVFVSPSHLEGMPSDVLSALAAARPVIATDIAGSCETVDENVNGTLVPPSDPAALAAAFARLAANRALLPPMARASRAKAERMFSSREVEASLLRALQMV